MKKLKISIKGFTLIELLVVISIVAILMALSIFGVQNAFENARDTRRKSDLKQYQSALENYASKNNGIFYASTSSSNLTGTTLVCTALGIGNCIADPKLSNNYKYCTDTTSINYVLWATVENPSSPVTYWIACSNGKTGTSTTQPSCGGSFNCQLP